MGIYQHMWLEFNFMMLNSSLRFNHLATETLFTFKFSKEQITLVYITAQPLPA